MLVWIIGLVMVGSPLPFSELVIDQKDLWLRELALCESNASSTIAIIDTNGYYSRGLFMFQMKTWLAYGKKFGATKDNILDPVLQYVVARSMLDSGLSYHWLTCSKRIGQYPVDLR